MPKKALASLNVVINAVTAPLFRGLKTASRRLQMFGAKMQAVGRSITHSFALPFAAIGAAGAKMAIDFEKNMTKINTLVGISGKEIKKLSEGVMSLSGQTAQAPAELAEGLFFLTSAGLRGANALETLEAVSKGVAIGLGEQTDLAKVAAAAQNAYGVEVISASQALDVFAGAVKEGMFEAADLADVLGTQLGMAASLGISFEETNAFIATYTKTTGDARAATTSFGGVMMSLAKTTPKMEKALNKVGMSGDSVRASLGEQGLMQTLIDIQTAFEDNNIPLSEFFSKAQALKGVLGVLGNQTGTYGSVLDGLNNSVGNVNEGFGTLEETAGFGMQKAFNDLKLAAQDLGTVMIPIFTKIATLATKVAKGFTSLDSGTKQIVVATASVIALSGPLATLAGGLVKAFALVLTPVGLVVTALAALFYVIYNNWGTTKKLLVDFINYFIDLYNESVGFRVVIESISLAFKVLWETAKLSVKNMWAYFSSFGKSMGKLFAGIGIMIKGALSKNPVITGMGVKAVTEALGMGVSEYKDQIEENTQEFVDAVKKAGKEFAANVTTKDKVEFITEEDIQENVDNIGNWFKEKLAGVRDMMKSFMGGGGGINLSPGGGGEEDTNNEEIKSLESATTQKLSIWQRYWNSVKTGMSNLGTFFKDNYQNMLSAASMVVDSIGNLWAAEHQKVMTIIDNEQTAEQEKLDADQEAELLALENSILTAEERAKAETDIKEKYGDAQITMDDKFDQKRKTAETRQARNQKDLGIMNAIISTAVAVMRALELGPVIGPPLAMLMGALGAAQVATIASTPIPMAEGGIAFGPTNALVGEYPGASSNPEVVAPLSKLKDMLASQMNVQLNVGGVVKGNDIYLSNENTTNQRPRYI